MLWKRKFHPTKRNIYFFHTKNVHAKKTRRPNENPPISTFLRFREPHHPSLWRGGAFFYRTIHFFHTQIWIYICAHIYVHESYIKHGLMFESRSWQRTFVTRFPSRYMTLIFRIIELMWRHDLYDNSHWSFVHTSTNVTYVCEGYYYVADTIYRITMRMFVWCANIKFIYVTTYGADCFDPTFWF